MASAKKYQRIYQNIDDNQNVKDKAIIEDYINKISSLIDNDQEKQVKAAQIVHNLINSSSKKGKL
tara:strand:+ start:75077 stop:75271 length:195 start_codon:yes stop_codon:yes gene_type:complete